MKVLHHMLLVLSMLIMTPTIAQQKDKKSSSKTKNSQPIKSPQQSALKGMTYNDILRELKNKKPQQSDWSMLNYLRVEIEQQMESIKQPLKLSPPKEGVDSKKISNMTHQAYQLMQQFKIPFNINENALSLLSKTSKPENVALFSQETSNKQIEAINNIVKFFKQKNYADVDQTTKIQIISKAINQDPDLENLRQKVSKISPAKNKEITIFINNTIEKALNNPQITFP